MSNGEPALWVHAEYVFMLNVLESADQIGKSVHKRVVLLVAAREQIRERKIPDEPGAKVAVTAEREAVLGIISRALEPPLSADPLGDVLTIARQRALDWPERNP